MQDEVFYISMAFICPSGEEPINTFAKGRPLMRQAYCIFGAYVRSKAHKTNEEFLSYIYDQLSVLV